ncbi:Glutathione-dependent formaldehyde-activating enzyme [compost metagenome]
MLKTKIKGGCLCGRVKYTISDAPVFSGKCYCKDCQRESGTGHSTAVAFTEEVISIEGATRNYAKSADSGGVVTRTFCPNCGSTLLVRSSNAPGMVIARAGTLDGSFDLDLSMAVFGCSQQTWDVPPVGLKVFDKMPPGE